MVESTVKVRVNKIDGNEEAMPPSQPTTRRERVVTAFCSTSSREVPHPPPTRPCWSVCHFSRSSSASGSSVSR